MKNFIHDTFLLNNKTAQKLFYEVAGKLPIVDFHNHLNPLYLLQNKRFDNLAQLWVNEDPYKHRAMRICGIAEEGITGGATDKEKYLNWVKTLPQTIGNPLFHWSCLELKRMFDVDEMLSNKNAEEVWNHCNKKLSESHFGAMNILQHWNTEIVCTSDDLTDDVAAHKIASENVYDINILPSLRGDSIIAFDAGSFNWMAKVSRQYGSFRSLDQYKEVIIKALDFFVAAGCRLADHSLDAGFTFSLPSDAMAANIFTTFQKEGTPSIQNVILLQSYLLVFLGKEYSKRGWTLQLHIGAQRQTSSRLRKLAGPAGGYATIGKSADIKSICSLLDSMEAGGNLPRIILYALNPADYAAFATLTGSYSEDGVRGKIQCGPAWWYNDHYEGIRQHLVTLSSYGLLSQFVGMTTDSRSLLSFSRHEYFRRVLCNVVGAWVEEGALPGNEDLLHPLIKNICYLNSKEFIFNK